MKNLSRYSLLLSLVFFAETNLKAQTSWSLPPIECDGLPTFFWVDSTDTTLYVGVNNLTVANNIPCKWGFRYKNGLVSPLPFQDSMIDQLCAITRYQNRLIVSSGRAVGSYDTNGLWQTIVPGTETVNIISFFEYDSALLFGGNFTNLMGSGATSIAAYDGTAFQSFHGVDSIIGPGWTAGSMVRYNGHLIVSGNFNTRAGFDEIAEWDGTRWKSVGGGIAGNGISDVWKLLVDGPDLYVAGNFSESAGAPGNNIARWDGSQWHRLGQGIEPRSGIYDLCMVHDTLLAAGPFFRVEGRRGFGIASYYNGIWCASPDSGASVSAIVNYRDTILAGGVFGFPGSVATSAFAAYNHLAPCSSGLSVHPARDEISFFISDDYLTKNYVLNLHSDREMEVGVQFIDCYGRILNSTKWRILAGTNRREIDGRELVPGLYTVSIRAANCTKNARLVAR